MYIPSETKSLHFLTTKLCVGCTKGFELVKLEDLATQGTIFIYIFLALLDPTDESLEFVLKRETVRPIAIFRVSDGSFFLCYNDFGFFINKLGRRIRNELLLYWSGNPSSFSYIHPYLIAYEPSFIEIRNVATGQLKQVIHARNLRVLNVDLNSTLCVMDGKDHQHLFKLTELSP